MQALFVSDLHLADERPATTAAFLAFLQGPARAAASLYILGDLFEYWAGDDDADAPLNRNVATALQALAAHGCSIHFMAGNRDLLLGDDYARLAGMQRLPDPWPLTLGGAAVLLSHGDALCTDDVPYQHFRQQVRDPAWQAAFLARPLADRKAFIEGVRAHSEAAKKDKAATIMDVNADAVEALLRQHGYPTLIHGHTHRPARHEHTVDGRRCERWVLADWDRSAPYLAFDGERFVVREFQP